MNAIKMLAIILLLAGTLALGFGGYSYTKKTHEAKVGSLEFSIKEKQTVNIPVWAGVAAIVVGGGLLFIPSKKRNE